jgi:hypothetical protein
MGEAEARWQKEIPAKSGMYWTATRDGLLGHLEVVAYDAGGKLVYAGGCDEQECWQGWWWSEPVAVPPKPGPW